MSPTPFAVRPKELIKTAISCIQDLRDIATASGQMDRALEFKLCIDLLAEAAKSLKPLTPSDAKGEIKSEQR